MRYTKYSDNLITNLLYLVVLLLIATTSSSNIYVIIQVPKLLKIYAIMFQENLLSFGTNFMLYANWTIPEKTNVL